MIRKEEVIIAVYVTEQLTKLGFKKIVGFDINTTLFNGSADVTVYFGNPNANAEFRIYISGNGAWGSCPVDLRKTMSHPTERAMQIHIDWLMDQYGIEERFVNANPMRMDFDVEEWKKMFPSLPKWMAALM